MMDSQRRHWLLGLGALAASPLARSQPGTWPVRPLRIVVPYAAGGPVDVVARVMAERLENYWQQRVLVDNRAGGNATIGTEYVAKSAPDGYTLLMGAPAHTANPSLMKLNFDTARDFTPISNIIVQPMVIAVHNSLPVNDLRALIELLKANPDKYNYGTSGAGGPQHLMGEIFKTATGTRIVHVPYKGAAPAGQALLAGETQVSFGTPTNTMPHVRTGRLRALAVSTLQRSPLAPDVPTLAELGFRDFSYYSWTGLFAPAGTPPEIIDKVYEGVRRGLAEAQTREKLLKAGMEPVGSSPEEFARFIAQDMARAAKVVRDTGLKAE
jgi:tripartite-type tricarboxylate transporter receptor subunit TctC